MLTDRPNPHDGPAAPARYRDQAREIAERLRRRWQARPTDDLDTLGQEIFEALVAEGEDALRQTISVARTRAEIALTRHDAQSKVDWPQVAQATLDLMDRLELIVETYLDQDRAQAQAIQLDREPFDLGHALDRRFIEDTTPLGPRRGRIDLGPAPVRGDKGQLVEVLWSLIERFHDEAVGEQRLVGGLYWEGREIQGYVGVSPGGPSLEILLDALRRPLDLSEVRIGIPFIRAVLELHGGRMFVAQERGGRGYGFRLPALASF